MRLATFNIYWLGGNKIDRNEEDLGRIAQVIAKINADVVVFEEIVDLQVLQQVVDKASDITARGYLLQDKDHRPLAAGKPQDQKVVVAFDALRCDLLAASPVYGGVGRLPFGLRLKSLAEGGRSWWSAYTSNLGGLPLPTLHPPRRGKSSANTWRTRHFEIRPVSNPSESRKPLRWRTICV